MQSVIDLALDITVAEYCHRENLSGEPWSGEQA